MNNQIARQKPSFSTAITTDKFQRAINNTLQDPNRARRFTSSIISAVSANPALQECEAGTIVSAALLGESLNLSPSPQLGQYYLVPFNDNKNHCKKAQFQLGYKGYIQLAIRSGYYKKLNVLAIKKGELVKLDPLEEEIEVQLIDDGEQREQAETIGYYAMLEYQNGFKKVIYWSIRKMMAHADKYSAAFSAEMYEKIQNGEVPEKDMWRYSSFWYKNFDGMAYKTMLRQLISKWGIMSIEMQDVYSKDMAVINEDGETEYIDTIDTTYTEVEQQEPDDFGEQQADVPTEEADEPMSLDDFD